MIWSLDEKHLHSYVVRLLHSYLPDGGSATSVEVPWVRVAMERLEYCFSHIHRKYYIVEGRPRFDHLNADHMASFLWFLGNSAWRDGGEDIAVRLSYLNKTMHGLDLFHSVAMPDIFVLAHPLGSVIGRGTFGNFLVVYQQVTIGAAESGSAFPTLGEGVAMYAGSAVIGDCLVGDNVVFAAHSMLVDTHVPSGSMVVGRYPEHRLLKSDKSVRSRCFD